ncbi:hypothetical protein BASA81_006816 [Batrachochytrium salamandrivorans]|nr:hypothetical protein BASA81_006816 [Batrachochytrium salamandrivorans]
MAKYTALPQADPDRFFVAKREPQRPHGPMVSILLLTMFLFAIFITTMIWPMINPEARPLPVLSYYPYSDIVGLVITSFMFAMFLINFSLTVVTDPGRVPKAFPWDPNQSDPTAQEFFIPTSSQGLRGVERKLDGRTRFCKKCNCYKPDRTHHCRKLGTCVLQMDHWCPWMRQTIGYFNRKYFFLTLTYAIASLICYLIVLGPYVVSGVTHPQNGLDYLLVISYILAGMELVLLLSFWGFHLFLTVHSFTTIEFREKHRASEGTIKLQSGEKVRDLYKDSLYDLGTKNAFYQLLGPYVLLWLIPTRYGMDVDPTRDGIVFPTKPDHPLLEQTSFKITSGEELQVE